MNHLQDRWFRRILPAPVDAAKGGSVPERVILVHGLARSSRSLAAMGVALRSAGYEVCHAAYPSTRAAPPRTPRGRKDPRGPMPWCCNEPAAHRTVER